MKQNLDKIFELEEENKFEEVFELYQTLYSENESDYEIWKNFHFFLWNGIEDSTTKFNERIEVNKLLQKMFDEGKNNFSELADFNFIAGYTVSIFPYEYGDYYDLEFEANQMLKKAAEIEPENLIYKLVYFGSISNVDKEEYRKLEIESSPKVLETFSGKGILNKYFSKVFI